MSGMIPKKMKLVQAIEAQTSIFPQRDASQVICGSEMTTLKINCDKQQWLTWNQQVTMNYRVKQKDHCQKQIKLNKVNEMYRP